MEIISETKTVKQKMLSKNKTNDKWKYCQLQVTLWHTKNGTKIRYGLAVHAAIKW